MAPRSATPLLGAALAVALNAGKEPIGGVLFNAASAASTAGFSAGEAQKAVPALALVTMVSMFMGGAAGSAAGGVKIARGVGAAPQLLRSR